MHVRVVSRVKSHRSDQISFRFNEAMVAVRRVPALEHNFNIVVTRVFEDGDQELLEDEDESKHPDCLRFLLMF